jgi:glycosyltransferase involved in cell wall biosynthesis
MAEIGEAGITHFHATSNDEWSRTLELLLVDAELRRTMGASGRRHAVDHYSLSEQTDKLARALHAAAAGDETSRRLAS